MVKTYFRYARKSTSVLRDFTRIRLARPRVGALNTGPFGGYNNKCGYHRIDLGRSWRWFTAAVSALDQRRSYRRERHLCQTTRDHAHRNSRVPSSTRRTAVTPRSSSRITHNPVTDLSRSATTPRTWPIYTSCAPPLFVDRRTRIAHRDQRSCTTRVLVLSYIHFQTPQTEFPFKRQEPFGFQINYSFSYKDENSNIIPLDHSVLTKFQLYRSQMNLKIVLKTLRRHQVHGSCGKGRDYCREK